MKIKYFFTIIAISIFCYDTYLYYYDYDTYIKWLDTVYPIRFRWADSINPFICLAIAIIPTIISRKLRKITQGDIKLKYKIKLVNYV